MTTITITSFTITVLLSWSRSMSIYLQHCKGRHDPWSYFLPCPTSRPHSQFNSKLSIEKYPDSLSTSICHQDRSHQLPMNNGNSLPNETSYLVSLQFEIPSNYPLQVARRIVVDNNLIILLPCLLL